MADHRHPYPNVEATLVAWLSGDAEFTAICPAERISTELPKTLTAQSRVQLFRTAGAPVDAVTEVIDRGILTLNTYGRVKDEAWSVIAAALSSLKRLEGVTVGNVFVSLTELVAGPGYAPDPTTDIARYVTTIAVTARSY